MSWCPLLPSSLPTPSSTKTIWCCFHLARWFYRKRKRSTRVLLCFRWLAGNLKKFWWWHIPSATLRRRVATGVHSIGAKRPKMTRTKMMLPVRKPPWPERLWSTMSWPFLAWRTRWPCRLDPHCWLRFKRKTRRRNPETEALKAVFPRKCLLPKTSCRKLQHLRLYRKLLHC